MKHIILDDDLHRIELEDGEWIDILELVPSFIRRKAQAAAMPMSGQVSMERREKGKKESVPLNVDFKVGEFNRVLLKEMVKAWSFKDKKEQAIPVTPENIQRLSEIDTDIVLKAIEKLNPERTDEEKKD